MKRRAVWCLMLLLSAMLIVSGCSKKKQESGGAGAVGGNKPAPEITVTSMKNVPLKLSSLKGKVVLLNFWATWCPPCRDEIPSMMKLNSAMAGKAFEMVSVSIDAGGVPDIEAYFKESGYSLPTYTDLNGDAQKVYGITGVPESFIIDKNGMIVKKVIGPLAWDSPDTITFIEGLMK